MSHELRTPLNAVLGFSDLLGEDRYGPLNDKQRRYVNHISTGGKHLLRLINDILDLSRIEAGRLQLTIETVRVDTSLSEACDTLQPLASKKNHHLIKHPAPGFSVRADGTRLRQILMNLIGNAVKFTPEGGTIELAAKKLGDQVRLEVRDSGPGIPPEEQKRIFEAFYRLTQKPKSRGRLRFGFGHHAAPGRTAWRPSLAWRASRAWAAASIFTLPLVHRTSSRLRKSRPADKDSPPFDRKNSCRGRRSDGSYASGDATHFRRLPGHSVHGARAGRSKWPRTSAFRRDHGHRDETHQRLASFDGFERAIAAPPRFPVIVVTIVDQPSTGALLGADEYVVKPVEKLVLLSAVDRCLRRSPRSGPPSILVVEDHPPTREFIAESLMHRGYLVEIAGDGAAARNRIARRLPHLVILDLILPDVSGFELLAEWRGNPSTAESPSFRADKQRTHASSKRNSSSPIATALLRKSDRWQDVLFQHLKQVVPPELVTKS